jgi:hypothetical protein
VKATGYDAQWEDGATLMLRAVLLVLGGWGFFTLWRTLKARVAGSLVRRKLSAVAALFCASCLLCAAALELGWFRRWLLTPLGVSFLLMIPLPCYFRTVDQTAWLRRTRNGAFVVLGLALLLIAGGVLPSSLLGL